MVRPHVFPALLVCYGLVAQSPAAPDNAQRLSLQEAIKISLENNLQVDIAQETRAYTQAGLLNAQGNFDWVLNGGLNWRRQDTGSTSSLYTGGPLSRTDGTNWNRNLTVGADKAFGWGGNLTLSYNPIYSYTTSVTPNGNIGYDTAGNPVILGNSYYNTQRPYSGTFSATYTQHLLSGFGREVTEVNVITARKDSESANYQFQQSIISLVADTESKYWDLVYAQRNLDNAKIALSLAQKQLNENKIRVEVGTLAPIEVTSAEAAVAQQEQSIISAEAALLNANDALIRALYPNKGQHPAKLDPSDSPTLSHIQLSEASAEKMALERRLELKIAKLSMESSSARRAAAENRLKPTLDAFVSYNGNSDSYTALSSVNSDITGSKFPGYGVGLSFSMPIGNRSAKGSVAQARANERSSQLSLKDKELEILLDVRRAIRNVDAAEKGVEASKKTRLFREKDLEAEQKKFENGMSTNFLVLSKQNDLDSARSSELQAQITYAKAVTALEQTVGNLLEARNLSYPK